MSDPTCYYFVWADGDLWYVTPDVIEQTDWPERIGSLLGVRPTPAEFAPVGIVNGGEDAPTLIYVAAGLHYPFDVVIVARGDKAMEAYQQEVWRLVGDKLAAVLPQVRNQ